MFVHGGQRREEATQVDNDIRNRHLAKVLAEVGMAEVRQDSDDLVGVSEGSDERTDGRAVAEVVEKLELIEDSCRRGGDVNLLDGDEFRAATLSLPLAWKLGGDIECDARRTTSVSFERRRRPLFVLLIHIPAVLETVILEIFSFVDGRKCACAR